MFRWSSVAPVSEAKTKSADFCVPFCERLLLMGCEHHAVRSSAAPPSRAGAPGSRRSARGASPGRGRSVTTIRGMSSSRHRNLACMWVSFRAVGAERLIITRDLEARSLIRRITDAVPGADVVVVRLRAPLDVVEAGIRERNRPHPEWFLDGADNGRATRRGSSHRQRCAIDRCDGG
jgi:hypothetical protein